MIVFPMPTPQYHWIELNGSANNMRTVIPVNQVLMITLLVLGVFGNFLVLIIACKDKCSAQNAFFVALAVFDSITLLFGVLYRSLGTITMDLTAYEMNIACILLGNGLAITGCTSGYILVGMTSLRAASVAWPHKVNWIGNKRNALIYVIFVALLLMSIEVPGIISSFFENKKDHIEVCNSENGPPALKAIDEHVEPWFQAISILAFPVLLILTNGVLVLNV